MAPRQRLSPQPSLEEIHPNHESSEASRTTRPLIQQQQQPPTSQDNDDSRRKLSKQVSVEESDIARERHDFFNLVALVRVKEAEKLDETNHAAKGQTRSCRRCSQKRIPLASACWSLILVLCIAAFLIFCSPFSFCSSLSLLPRQ